MTLRKGGPVIALLLLLLAASLALPALILAVVVGQVLALLVFDRLATRSWKHADKLVTVAERGPANVVYLSDRIAAQRRDRRLLRLLERS
jgi:hypothetical protein